jgi:2-oxoisovalerate ferredoxin oxidoreductase beta subunit
VVHKYIAEAIDHFGVQDRTILVNSVGCSVFAYYYFDVGNIQAAHGRCPAVATAAKRAHPDSLVIGYQGDGDLAAIGGNEIVHAANRGENISIFFINNAIYGMTGGQMAPTTVLGMRTSTTPAGRRAENEGYPIRVCELLSALQAPYYLERVAIGDPKHNHRTRRAVRKAIQYQLENKGFSLVEILSPCPTGWKLSPLEAARWATTTMTESFPLGVYRDGHQLDLGHPRRRGPLCAAEVPELLELDDDIRPSSLRVGRNPIEEARLKISGFGGQGVLLLGIVMAKAAMLEGRRVSWMPSYGPEMRGGTAHCNVTISDGEIGSPIIEAPTALVAMNEPSFTRFRKEVASGGVVFFNSSLIPDAPRRSNVTHVPVPANDIADRLGNPRVANMVLLGAMLAHPSAVVSIQAVHAALPSALKVGPELLELNKKAIRAGMEVTVTS